MLMGILKIGRNGVDCFSDRPDEQGKEPTCRIQGREFNKIAEQILASQEGTVLHGDIC
jgi:hypothetical protein